MVRILMICLVSAAAGLALGWTQAAVQNSGTDERFFGTRYTKAVAGVDSADAEIQLAGEGTPKLEVVGGTDFDFGMMQHGESMSHAFVFRNIGDGPLFLEMGQSSCKCTVGELDSSILQPGEETEVTLTWKAQAQTRHFGQSATILTNDTEQLEVKLQVRGEIANSFVTEPPAIELGTLSDTETVSRTFHVFTYLENAQELEAFQWGDAQTRDLVDFEVTRVDVDAEEFPMHKNALVAHRVNFTIHPGLPLGPLSSRIQFKTDQGDNVGTLGLPVTGKIVGQLQLSGGPSFDSRLNLVKLGNIKSSEGASVTIFLFIQGENHEEIIPEVASIVPEEALKVSLGDPRKSPSRSIYPVHFEVPKGAPEVYYPASGGKNHGRVVIKTQGAISKELPINVRMIVTQ